MPRRIFSIALYFLLFVSTAKAQHLDTLYLGGKEAYSNTLKNGIKYPREAFSNNIEGILVFSITVDSSAQVSLQLLTKLDNSTEQEIIKIASPITKNWIAKKETYTLYQPLIFTRSGFRLSEQPYSKLINTNNVLEPLTILGFQKTNVRVEKQAIGYSATSRPPSNALRTPTNTPNTPSSPSLPKLSKQLEKALKKEKWEKAYQVLNEVIRLNPFNKEYILRRNQLESQLGLSDYKAYDLAWFKALNLINATTL